MPATPWSSLPPSAVAGATSYNVYVSTSSGGETQQNSSPTALGTNFTELPSAVVIGSYVPVDQIGDGNLTETLQYAM